MITVEVIAVGKIKEDYLKKAIEEYSKRLSRYCTMKITEIPDFPDDKNSVEREGVLIIPKIKGVCIPLCIEGKQMESIEFAKFIEKCTVEGNSHITFVIGGSNGLDNKIKDLAKLKLSFSKMTFPHQLMRVILLEQIYRAFKIINNEAYHK
jgi:23S rRNA (pseudouridine1915-N3)-methyltransferase